MIARIWHGAVPVSKGSEYLGLMRKIALPAYQATQGNRGAWCLHRAESDATHFQMLTFWDDIEAIRRFAGDDYKMAKYYGFDSDYLIEMEPQVLHYDVYLDSSFGPTPGQSGQDGNIARVWRGAVPIEKADGYFPYLFDFGFRDYQAYDGICATYLLRRPEDAQVQFLLLSFWTSRESIVAYAGANIEKARYYPYDLECLIDPSPDVEHYEISRA